MTIYEIAAEAGVSITTVSRVLNSPEKVAPKTKERVEAVLKKHNYFPNAFARGLVSNSMKTIGILMADIKNRHFATAAYVLENHFFNWDYSTILCNTDNTLEKEKKYIQTLAGKKVDGIVLIGSRFEHEEIKQLIKEHLSDTPIVIINGSIDLPNTYSVSTDHNYGMMLAVSHLLKRGKDKICFVHSTNTPNAQRKAKGFIKALAFNSLSSYENQTFECSDPFLKMDSFQDEILNLAKTYNAFIFSEDYLALVGTNVFKNAGYDVPHDISLIGHDNSIFSVCSQPQLTTIDTKLYDISTVAANTMHSIFIKEPVGESTILRPELIIRGTT